MNTEQRFADYILFEKLSTTAFGDCFRAGKTLGNVIDRHVLLQLFNGSSLEGDSFWQLVADRQPLVESLRDPHLGESIAFDRIEESAFAVYSYTPSRPLDQFFAAVRDQKLPVPVEQALFIIERAALGLTAAHGVTHRGRPVLHGFLVPELIHLSSDGEIRVLGIEAAPGLRSQLARHPAFAPYLAPEVRDGQAPTATDDVFSLGALLFHLLSGNPLPTDSPETLPQTVDDATLAAGGEPLPSVIKNLLKNSLSPRANRISDAVTWQQVLGKIILDGEHNPSTFNLSFLMHTIFRSELEAELAQIPQETALRLGPAAVDEGSLPGGSSVIDPESLAKTPEIPPEETGPGQPFLTGFMVSFLTAAIFMASYFVFFRTPGEADTGDLAPPPEPLVASVNRTPAAVTTYFGEQTTEPLSSEVPALSTETIFSEPEPLDDPADTSDEDIEAQIQTLLASRTEDLETTLRAEYEARLEELERQFATTATTPAGKSTGLVQPQSQQQVSLVQQPLDEPSESLSSIRETTTPAEIAVDPADTDSVEMEATDLIDSSQNSTSTPALTQPDIGPTIPEPARSVVQESIDTVEEASEQLSEEPENPQPTTVFAPPRLEVPPQPRYPGTARRLRKAATVTVRVLVEATGQVSVAELVGPPAGFGFDSAAVAAAKRSRWTPATRNDQPVESWALLTIEFQP